MADLPAKKLALGWAMPCRGHKRQAAASRSSLKLHQCYWHT